MEYIDFLKSKIETAPVSGFELDAAGLCGQLKPLCHEDFQWFDFEERYPDLKKVRYGK